MLNISKRARLMLDLLFGVSAALALLMALDVGLEMSWGRGVAVALAVLAAVGAWVTWRRHDGAADRAVLVLVSCVFVVALVGDGPSGLPLFFVALIVLIVEHGSLAGLAAVAALVIGLVLVMAVAYRRPLEDIVPQSIGVLVLLALGLLIAQLVRETDQSRRENARLLAELRASLDSEKDLVLAQERARSASDLHDGLGHQLTAIQMGLDFADRMRTRDPHAAWEEVGRARDLSAVALDRMRVWVRALDPVRSGPSPALPPSRPSLMPFAAPGSRSASPPSVRSNRSIASAPSSACGSSRRDLPMRCGTGELAESTLSWTTPMG